MAVVDGFVGAQHARGGDGATQASGDAGACGAEASSLAQAADEVQSARAGEVVCLAQGSYGGGLSLNASPGSYVTLRPAPGAHVSVGGVSLGGSHLIVRGLWISGEVLLAAGASHMVIEHNDISGGGEGIVFQTSDCAAPNAPSWSGCESQPPVSDVTISANHIHNIGQGSSEDAIHLDNWRGIRVIGNELDHIVESGNHTDCLQSVYGGSDLVFSRNYEHDNDCQGFFIKDGDATDVTVTDNLFVRDRRGRSESLSQVWNVSGLTVERNTIWDGEGLTLVADDAVVLPSAKVDHNLLWSFSVASPKGRPYELKQQHNLLGEAPWSFAPGRTDRVLVRPPFVNVAIGDYRLARNPHGIGVDWSPAEVRYGPER